MEDTGRFRTTQLDRKSNGLFFPFLGSALRLQQPARRRRGLFGSLFFGDGRFLRLRCESGPFAWQDRRRNRSCRPEQVWTGFGRAFGADFVAAGEEGGEAFVGLRGARSEE